MDQVESTAESFDCSVRLSEDDFVNMQRTLVRLTFPRGPFWLLTTLALVMVGLGGTYLGTGFINGTDRRLIACLVLGIGVVLCVCVLVMSTPVQSWFWRRLYRRYESSFPKAEVRLSSYFVTLASPNARAVCPWDSIGLVASAKQGLLFCSKENRAMFWLPNRVFDPPETRARVLELATSNGVAIEPIR